MNKKFSIPLSIWSIGIVTLFLNISSVMVFGLSAVYLKSYIGVSMKWIGLLEGIVEGTAYALRVLSGVFSDYFRKRKAIILIGFSLMTLARPVLALSSGYLQVFLARLLDRIGNGIQSTPRDALISDVAPKAIRGSCFGLRQALGTAGSCFGGILGILAMYYTANNFHAVFALAAIPALLAILIMVFMVKDAPLKHPNKTHPIYFKDLLRLGANYWRIILVAVLFMLARLGEAFLILHAENFGMPHEWIPGILVLYNASYSLTSYPIGKLSDKFNRYKILAFGIIVLFITDIILFSASSLGVVICGVVFWGVQMGISQSIFATLVASNVPNDLRGTGFGFFYLLSGFALFLAGSGAGYISEIFGQSQAFLVSAIISLVALMVLLIVARYNKH